MNKRFRRVVLTCYTQKLLLVESSFRSVTSYFWGKCKDSNYSPELFQVIAFEFCKREWNQVYSLNVQLGHDFKSIARKGYLTRIILSNKRLFQKFILGGCSFHDLSIIFVQFLSNVAMFGYTWQMLVWCLTFPVYCTPIILDFTITEEKFYRVFAQKTF